MRVNRVSGGGGGEEGASSKSKIIFLSCQSH